MVARFCFRYHGEVIFYPTTRPNLHIDTSIITGFLTWF
ncbi:hypothetical protein LTSEWAN_0563 [Salmonella enterica subsp. enterica serovar Wandsworth str. A4-580]|uniref:Uncharacterized protein n=1 Tax=Salmonella enterica subsp. enterica serovar Wandsworth str. A4-580 TaxID=913086 RepID=G5S703_SALET|nr:hypothetical protein SeSPA_A0862 [Salmonella enterica subsp. enterica serovar Saintpaul str. SARA23]EHD06300.1 hypothetical protein LTSEWAN_0563 [Salmonella enterica subsp. enterica serovar Wandsworth str. A4-580]EHJ84156.1 hypothetical protein LTSEBAI_0744 [Salmonella enterica subsp. enterica serovar Baildon str. R6-199]